MKKKGALIIGTVIAIGIVVLVCYAVAMFVTDLLLYWLGS
jgi:hypothetical protein